VSFVASRAPCVEKFASIFELSGGGAPFLGEGLLEVLSVAGFRSMSVCHHRSTRFSNPSRASPSKHRQPTTDNREPTTDDGECDAAREGKRSVAVVAGSCTRKI
jgi:hypothetical protein